MPKSTPTPNADLLSALAAMLAANSGGAATAASNAIAKPARTASVSAPATVSADDIVLRQYDYQGNKMIEFSGPFRPFSLSSTKVRRVLAKADALRKIIG